jgi:hypothetical protein
MPFINHVAFILCMLACTPAQQPVIAFAPPSEFNITIPRRISIASVAPPYNIVLLSPARVSAHWLSIHFEAHFLWIKMLHHCASKTEEIFNFLIVLAIKLVHKSDKTSRLLGDPSSD